MSQWTHCCGLIRIDAIPEIDGTTIMKVSDRFGNKCNYDDDKKTWDACTVPCGSEGSLHYEIKKTGNEHEVSWGVVYIWGDLRDYEDYRAIYEWIKKACEPFMIRSCAVKIDVEYHGEYLVTDVFGVNKTTIELIEISHAKNDPENEDAGL